MSWVVVGVGDLSGDGQPDILWRHQASGKNVVWTMNGVQRLSGFYMTPDTFADVNWKMAGVGDFNLDGRPDVAIGAPFDDAGGAGVDRGRVYVYPGPLSSSNIILSGEEDGATFGFSVASVGDFNGDGRPDLAVGAPLNDGDGDSADSGDNRGRVFVFLGGPTFPAGVITLTGTVAGGQFGFSVARAGDVDGNGSDDLLVGAPFEPGAGTERGRAHLFLGSGSPSTTPALTFTGSEDFGHFGFSVSTAGLLNNDSFFDWMIGAPTVTATGAELCSMPRTSIAFST